MKTVKQISEETGISKQRIYRFLKQSGIGETVKDSVNGLSRSLYDETVEDRIKEHFHVKKQELAEIIPAAKIEIVGDPYSEQGHNIADLKLIRALKIQLEEKDRQIEQLHRLLDQEQKLHLTAKAVKRKRAKENDNQEWRNK